MSQQATFYVEVRSANSSNHRPYRDTMYGEQQCALHLGEDFPVPFKVNVQVGKEHAPGRYGFASGTFGTDQHGNLRVNKVRIGQRLDAPPPIPAKG